MIPQSPQPNEFNPDNEIREEATGNGNLPANDFLEDELDFVRELNSLFSPEQEELPPLFIQTLHNEQTGLMAPARLEQRLRYRVFRKLQLPQQPLNTAPHEQVQKPARRRGLRSLPRAWSLGALFVVVLMCLLALSPSLIGDLQWLLTQTPTQVPSEYTQPKSVANLALTHYLPISEVQTALSFNVYWLGVAPENYNYQSLLLHMNQRWSDGPIVEVRYGHDDPMIGYGDLSLYEFRPAAGENVTLETAPPDAVETIVFTDTMQAIYINGRWVRQKGKTVWEYGIQAQMLYQTAGLVFWITADQRDESTPQRLIDLMNQSMDQLYLGPPRPSLPELPNMPRAQAAPALAQATADPTDQQVLLADFPDTNAAVFIALGGPPGTAGQNSGG